MTPIGRLIMGWTSIVIVVYLMIRSILGTKKGGSGIEFILLVPVLIFLTNTI